MTDFNKASLEKQAKHVSTPFPTPYGCEIVKSPILDAHLVSTPFPTPRTYEGVEYYGADDVAKIIGVTRRNVLYWHQRDYFTADKRAHDGRYLYIVERVLQLKDVYRPDWNQPAYIAHVDDAQPISNPPPYTSPTNDVAAVKRLSRDARAELARRINETDPHSIFKPAGETSNPNKRKIICPHCGNGSGKDATPVDATFKDGAWLYHCFKSSDLEGTLLKIIATENNLTLSNFEDFCTALAIGAALAGITVENGDGASSQHQSQRHYSRPKIELQLADLPAQAPEYERLAEARLNLPKWFEWHGNIRGLTKETLGRLLWGLLYDFKHPNPNDKMKFVALIIPNDKGGIFARELKPAGNKDKGLYRNINPTTTTTIVKPTADKILFVVEGAIDGASIAQATDFQHGIIAIGGTSGGEQLLARLNELFPPDTPRPKVVLMLDNDDTDPDKNSGQIAAAKLLPKIRQLGFVAVNRVICDETRRDANKILIEDGEEILRNRIETSIADAQDELAAVEKELAESAAREIPEIVTEPALEIPDDMREELAIFKDKFGEIDPKVLPKLEAAKKFIDGLTPQNIKAAFAYEPATRNKIALCKFYLPSVAQKFFDTLKAARKLSRDILKQISRETTALEKAGEPVPSVDLDEVTRLADIAPSKILLIIDEVVTSLKNKQRSFAKHKHAERSEMPKNAATDAQNAFSAWTQNNIKDCPINLFIPENVYFSTSGVGTQRVNKLGELEIYPATKSPIVPTKIFRTPKSHATKYEIAVKSRRHWRHIIVDGDELADPKKILRLAKDGGALIKNAKNLTGFFAEIIAANEDRLPEIACYTRPGWHEGKFIYPTPENEDSYRVERSGIDYQDIFKARGDKDAWLSKFLEITYSKQGALKRFIFGACAIAPLLQIIKIPNPQINLWGTSNFAKTPLPKFGLSIFGDPGEGKMFRTWSATPKNMLTTSAGFNDLPILVDEGETMSKWTQVSLSEYIYNFSIGIIGQANKRNGEVRATEKFHGVRLSTAERPLHDTSDKRGAFKRLIDIHVTEELFEDSYARQLHIFCERNHGHFGRQWTRYIEDHADKITADFETAEKFFAEHGFKRDGFHADLKSVDATNARVVIACAVAYQHFYTCVFEDVFDLRAAIFDAADILHQLPTVDEISDVNRSIELLASWVVENPTRFITPRKHEDGSPIDNADNPATSYAGTVGKKFADGRIAFFPNAFRKIVADIGLPSYEKFLGDLYDADFLDCPSRRDKNRVIKIDGKNARVFMIKACAFALDSNHTDEID